MFLWLAYVFAGASLIFLGFSLASFFVRIDEWRQLERRLRMFEKAFRFDIRKEIKEEVETTLEEQRRDDLLKLIVKDEDQEENGEDLPKFGGF